jgi:hypothetical protein
MFIQWASSPSAIAAVTEIFTVAETSLIESFPTHNLGAEGYVTCGSIQNPACGTINLPLYCRNRALFKFDIAGAIPPGSRIQSVQLRFWMVYAPQDPEANPSGFELHRLLVPWVQGTGTNQPGLFPGTLGRPALPGEPCWEFRQTPDVPWGLPGGAPGVDFAAEPSGFMLDVVNRPNETYTVIEISNRLVADVQLWLDNPAANHGWLLKATDESLAWTAKRFLTPESGLDNYPRLEIQYLPPPRLEGPQVEQDEVRFSFLAEPEQPYQIQFTSDLGLTWSNLLLVPPTPEGTNVQVADPLIPDRPRRFYRVLAP